MVWKDVVSPALAAILTALILWLFNFAKGVPTIITPNGAVVAFNLASCPDGWSDFKPAMGRTIIGVGKGDGLTERTLLENKGTETHTLTIQEMPSHTHSGNVGTGGDSFEHHKDNERIPSTQWSSHTGYEGGGKEHNIMQPFIALRYCIKN